MYDPVSDGTDFLHRLQYAEFGVDKNPQHPLDGGAVLEDFPVVLVGLAVGYLEHKTRI